MTPKGKANRLVDKMLYCYQGHIDEYAAKQCAIIAVDEILKEYWSHDTNRRDYWKEVKQEIEKL